MNAFFEHHQDSIRLAYRCFDRLLLNGLIQPFQQPERVIGFFNTYREGKRVTRDVLHEIERQFRASRRSAHTHDECLAEEIDGHHDDRARRPAEQHAPERIGAPAEVARDESFQPVREERQDGEVGVAAHHVGQARAHASGDEAHPRPEGERCEVNRHVRKVDVPVRGRDGHAHGHREHRDHCDHHGHDGDCFGI